MVFLWNFNQPVCDLGKYINCVKFVPSQNEIPGTRCGWLLPEVVQLANDRQSEKQTLTATIHADGRARVRRMKKLSRGEIMSASSVDIALHRAVLSVEINACLSIMTQSVAFYCVSAPCELFCDMLSIRLSV